MTDAHELLEQLVAFPSVAGRPNDEVAGFIAGWLRGHGIECVEVRGASGRVNLLASTGAAAGGVLLAAHMDVVEVGGPGVERRSLAPAPPRRPPGGTR